MSTLSRSYWVLVAVVVYTCIGAARSGGGLLPWLACFVLPLALAEVFRRTGPEPGDDADASEAHGAVRTTFWGVAMLVAARTGGAAHPALDAAANLGAGAATVGALLALARLPKTGGLLIPTRSARSLDAAVFSGFLWGIATAVPGAYALFPAPTRRFDPLLIDYATTSAGLGTLLVLVSATLRLWIVRGQELGIADRARSAFALCLTAFTVAVPAAWLDVAPPDRVLPAASAVAAAAATWAAAASDPTRVTRALRGLLAVLILGAPLLLIATFAVQTAPKLAPAVVLVATLGAIAVGLVARDVARPLGPERSRWLSALDHAAREALGPEPEAALRATLLSLTRISRRPGPQPEIWQRDPPESMSVDLASNLRRTPAEAPERLYELGLLEPERTLKTAVLKALEVKKPEVRGLLTWMKARGALCATIILDEDGPLGLLLLPQAGRKATLTVEEARAARLLADRLGSLLAVASALARARQRELQLTARAESAETECQRLERVIGADAERHRSAARRLARAVTGMAYSAAARDALIDLERLGRTEPLLVLIGKPGADPIPWAAHYHLSSPREGGPFLVVDISLESSQGLEPFREDPDGPLTAADGGTLVVLGLTALSSDGQAKLAQVLEGRAARVPISRVEAGGVVLVLSDTAQELSRLGVLSPELSRRFQASARVPSLAERPEDLRALCLDALGRRSLELGREPLGLDPSALHLLMEHTWPLNEMELFSVLGRAALFAENVVTAEHLRSAGFRPIVPAPQDPTPLPQAPRRRASMRPARRS